MLKLGADAGRKINAPASDIFERLGALTGRLWKEHGYDIRRFSSAAMRALEELPPSQYLTLWDTVQWAMLNDPLPTQLDIEAKFGQPPVTVYHWGREFHIELLYWVTGVPSIHEHSFSGAFHVLHGSSLHTQWRFGQRRTWGAGLAAGDLTLESGELLRAGDSRPIIAGSELIHATFHVDRPSVTLVIRTNGEKDSLPQLTYVPPGIAYDDELAESTRRRIQMLGMLRVSGLWMEYGDVLRYLLGTADALTVFHVVMATYMDVEDADHRSDVLAIARSRHRDLIDALEPALAYLDRRRRLVQLRAGISDPDLQFFLALLLNIDNHDAMAAVVAQRHPGHDPSALLTTWAADVAPRVFIRTPREVVQHIVRELLEGDRPAIETTAASVARVVERSWFLQPLLRRSRHRREALSAT